MWSSPHLLFFGVAQFVKMRQFLSIFDPTRLLIKRKNFYSFPFFIWKLRLSYKKYEGILFLFYWKLRITHDTFFCNAFRFFFITSTDNSKVGSTFWQDTIIYYFRTVYYTNSLPRVTGRCCVLTSDTETPVMTKTSMNFNAWHSSAGKHYIPLWNSLVLSLITFNNFW